ncbi:MAG TPA: metallophosphoesterase family protein [Blastocatellia bacterium]|nr:metallophosphoesterase family protein [Blastocatellia bacterium]
MSETTRTLVIGDVHGKLSLLDRLLEEIQYKPGTDRLVFIGDLVDRGEDSRGVVARALELRKESPELVTVIRGNHEEMMIDALSASGAEAAERSELWYFNGGIETLQSYMDEEGTLNLPEEHFDFLASLPTWHEDEHAIYVHAAMIEAADGTFIHPGQEPNNLELLWSRNRRFFAEYKGKLVVFGHTIAGMIFGEPEKVWLREHLIGVDTGAYLTGVLSAVELPSRQVWNVREELNEADLQEYEGARKRLFSRRNY